MLFARSSAVAHATCSSLSITATSRPVILDAACARLRAVPTPTTTSIRHASHGTAGRANGPKNGPGKRLGAKKTGDEYVIPGNIIFRQRGTLWHPGENVGMGRDHTIFSLQTGYVKYYRNPRQDPKKRYIGVVFDRTQALPTPLNAVRRRRLGMVAVKRRDIGVDVEALETGEEEPGSEIGALPGSESAPAGQQIPVAQTPATGLSKQAARELKRKRASGRLDAGTLDMRPNYSYRESNFAIGRAAERAGVVVKEFQKGNRFLAWRKKGVRKAKNAERRSLGKKKGSTRKGKRGQ